MKRTLLVLTVLFITAHTPVSFAEFAPQDLKDYEVVVPDDEKIETDTRIIAGNILVNGDITGSSVMAGGNVVISSEHGESLTVFGGNLEFSGVANEDVRVWGMNVEIPGHIKGGALVFGLKVLLNGEFDDDVRIWGGKVVLNGTFKKGVELYCDEAELGPETVIEGDLKYSVKKKIKQDSGAKVKGEMKDVTEDMKRSMRSRTLMVRSMALLFVFLSFIVTGLILSAVFPNHFQKVSHTISMSVPRSMFVGMLSIFGVPVAVVILFITIIGIPGALILTSAYFVILYLSFIFSGTYIGSMIIVGISGKEEAPLMSSMFVGLLLICLVGLIPNVGSFVLLLAAISGFGGFVLSLFKKGPPAAFIIGTVEGPMEQSPESDMGE